jgi:exopolyphosphatase/pppGpp-phosphohydrolase
MHLENKEFQENEVHGLQMTSADIDRMFKKYSNWTPDQFLLKFPFLGKRAEAIRGGLILATHLIHRLRVKNIYVSTYGLRYGSFVEGGVPDEYLAR